MKVNFSTSLIRKKSGVFFVLAALSLDLFFLLNDGFDIDLIIWVLFGLPLLCLLGLILILVLRLFRIRIRLMQYAFVCIVNCCLAFSILKCSDFLRPHLRWILVSNTYKALVLAQPPASSTNFRSAEWDGWGWAGMDTTAYIVYDPKDELRNHVSEARDKRVNGLPCPVAKIFRLEKSWYSVVFYTDSSWDLCP